MNAKMVSDTIDELNFERRLARRRGDLVRYEILTDAIRRIYDELDRERRRPTADPSTRATADPSTRAA